MIWKDEYCKAAARSIPDSSSTNAYIHLYVCKYMYCNGSAAMLATEKYIL